eukprot:scaffold125380_cov57-Phaeocystis_antarctica.AAC.3
MLVDPAACIPAPALTLIAQRGRHLATASPIRTDCRYSREGPTYVPPRILQASSVAVTSDVAGCSREGGG